MIAASEDPWARQKTVIVGPRCTAYGLAADIISTAD